MLNCLAYFHLVFSYIMATSSATSGDSMSFEDQITRISAVIKSRINALVDRLREREKSLLKELEEILSKYKQEKEREAQRRQN